MPLETISTEFERLKRSGDAHFGRKEYRIAVESYREALKHGKGDRHLLFNFAYGLAEIDDFEGAAFRYRRAVDEGAGASAHNNLGNALRRLGRVDEAKAEFLKAARLDPSKALFWRNLASCHSEQKDPIAEVAALQALFKCKDVSASDWNSLGRAHAARLDHESALAAFRVGAFISPMDPSYFFNMALMMERCGRVLDAYHACRHSLRLKADYESAAQKLPLLEAVLKHIADSLNTPRLSDGKSGNSDSPRRISIFTEEIGPQDYINPYVLLDIPVVEADSKQVDWFQKPADWLEVIGSLTRRRRALKAELELNDGHLSWLPGLRITDEIVHRVLSVLDDDGWHPHHWAIFRLPLLNRFLMAGDAGYFHSLEAAPYPLVADIKGIDPGDPEHEQFIAFLSPFFRHRWTISIKQALQHGNYQAGCGFFSTNTPVLSGELDEAIEPVRRHFGEKCSVLRHLEEDLEKGLRTIFDEQFSQAHPQAGLLNMLPEHSGAKLSEDMCAGYRRISIALANHRKDYHAADCALKAAEAFKVSEMMHQRLQKDRKALNSFLATAAAATRSYDFSKAATQRAASPSKSKVNSGNVGCLVFLVIAGLFQFFASSIGKWRTSQPSSIKSTEAASSLSQSTPRRLAAPTPESYSAARREPIVTSNPIDAPDLPRGDSSQLSVDSILPDIGGNTRTYRLPSHYMAELRADQKTIDSEKTKVTAFGIRLSQAEKKVETEKAKFDRVENRLMQINTHIQEERAYLDKRNPSAVAEWNRMLRNYNDLSVEVNALNFGANQAVQAYNTILAGMRRQNEIFNSMVNKYNAKLAQYGRLVASE